MVHRGHHSARFQRTGIGSQLGMQPDGLGGDPQRDAHDDKTRDQRAEQVALVHRHGEGHKEADGRQIAKRQHLVTWDDHGDQNGQRDKDQAGGDHGGMAQQQRRIEADKELLATKACLQAFTGMLGDGRQAIHDRFDHPRHQQHHGSGFHRQLQNALQVITGQRTDNQPHHKADGHWLAERTKAFLYVVCAEVNAVQAGDLLDNGVHQYGDRPHIGGGAVRNGNPFQPEEVAGVFGEPVPQLVNEGGMHHHAQHTQPV